MLAGRISEMVDGFELEECGTYFQMFAFFLS
jgi:hypothetical protein